MSRIIDFGGKYSNTRAASQRMFSVNSLTSRIAVEIARYEKGEAKARRVIKDAVRSETDSFHWPHKPRMADELEPKD
jgi:hypothetical protein